MRTPTIKDVADRAGVGIGTVSRVLNGSPQVRQETRQRVLAAIQELGFKPNTAARQLSGGRTFTVGVVSPIFTLPSFIERLTGIQDILDAANYDLVLYSIRYVDQFQRQLRALAKQNRVDGLIIILSMHFYEDEIRQISPTLPVVVIDNDTIEHYPHIMIDNYEGGRLATNYLIERGHHAIGFVGDVRSDAFGFTSTYRRYEGFRASLAAAGLEVNEEWCRFGDLSEEAARHRARPILTLPRRPTAIFAGYDTLAFGVLAAAQELGLRVPDDIAVMGFDDIQTANYLNLTTVRQNLAESGRLGARLILEWLRNGYVDEKDWVTRLPLEIIPRATA